MKREEYLEKIKLKTGVDKKYIDIVIKEYLELLKEKIITEKKASITNFGTFNLRTTKPHTIFSPVDGSKIKSEGVNRIYFSTSKDFQNKL
ncbi:MAG: HU family DNA-binding protein [Bacilli bacterium]